MWIINASMRKDKNVYEYTDDKVTVLYSDRDRVRQSPTVYIPGTDINGVLHLYQEIFTNAIDELLAPGSIGSEIFSEYNEKTKTFTVIDNGRGLPHGKIFDMCEVLASSAKMGKNRAYAESAGLNGMGMKLVNFLTKSLTVKSERDGKFIEIHYEDGLRKEVKQGKSKDHGTTVTWTMYDKKFFSNTNVTCEMILDLIEKKAYVTEGLTMTFTGITKKGQEINKVIKGSNLKTYMKKFNTSIPVLHMNNILGDSKLELLISYDTNSLDDYDITAYTNGLFNKDGGSHVNGILDAVSNVIREYMYSDYLSANDKKIIKLRPEDIRTGLVGIVSVYTLSPKFTSQWKVELGMEDIKRFVFNTVRKNLKSLDTTTLRKICAIVKQNAKARMASETSKKRVKKDITNIFSDSRIEKFTPISKHSTSKFKEMSIVEGDSACEGVKSTRDKYSHAVLAIRGKPENVFDLDVVTALKKSKFLSNMNDILDAGIGDKFDLDKVIYNRINLMCDADPDGDSIAASIGSTFLKFFPGLVEDGRLYRVLPPLYEVKLDGKNMYVSTVREFMTLAQKKISENHTLYANGTKMSEEDTVSFLTRTERYIENLNKLSKQYALTPELMQCIYNYRHLGFKESSIKDWNKVLSKHFRFVTAEMGENGYITISGMIDSTYNLFEYTPEFDDDYEIILGDIEDSIYGYSIDSDKTLSLYDILIKLEKYQPKIMNRFKGLGQQSPTSLKETVVNREKRRSIQMTARDIKKSIKKASVMHSKKKEYKDKLKKHIREFKFDPSDIDT